MMEGMQNEYHYIIHLKLIFRLKEEKPEDEQKTHETNLSSGHCSSIQRLLKEDIMNKTESKLDHGGNGNIDYEDDENLQNIKSETTDNEDDESLQNIKPEMRDGEENPQNSRVGKFFQKQILTLDIYCSST